MLDKDFWIEALLPVHVMVLDPRTDWKTWATDVLTRAQQHIGRPIPMTSQSQPEDEANLQNLLQELRVPEPFGEKDALDRFFHMLQEGDVVVDHVFNEKVFFLLYRLIE